MPFLGGPARWLAVAVCIPDIDGLERRMAPGGRSARPGEPRNFSQAPRPCCCCKDCTLRTTRVGEARGREAPPPPAGRGRARESPYATAYSCASASHLPNTGARISTSQGCCTFYMARESKGPGFVPPPPCHPPLPMRSPRSGWFLPLSKYI